MGLIVSLVTSPGSTTAEPSEQPRVASGWLPSWDTPTALANIETNDDLFGDASPFWYSAKASDGSVALSTSVRSASRATVLASLRSRGVAVIPSVSDASGAHRMAAILASPSARSEHVSQLVALVLANGYDGIELDYERFAFSDGSSTWATTRPAWVAFVTELGAALHARGKLLALAVPPIYDGTRSSSSGYWVYDYAGIAGSVDSLRIMTYDYSVSRPGPISPLSFLRRTLTYAVTAFPAERIRMGLPAYGRVWTALNSSGAPSISGTCPVSGVPGTRSFKARGARTYLAAIAGTTPSYRFDSTTGERMATFRTTYTGAAAGGGTTSCVVDHEAWWVDTRAVGERLPLVAEFGLAGVAIWHLGGVQSGTWEALRTWQAAQEPPVPPAPPTATPAPPPTATPTSTASPAPRPSAARVVPRVVLTPSTLRSRRGQIVRFRVKVSPAKTNVKVRRKMRWKGRWITKNTARTNAKGRAVFRVRWPNSTIKRTYKITTKKRGSLAAGRSGTVTLRTR